MCFSGGFGAVWAKGGQLVSTDGAEVFLTDAGTSGAGWRRVTGGGVGVGEIKHRGEVVTSQAGGGFACLVAMGGTLVVLIRRSRTCSGEVTHGAVECRRVVRGCGRALSTGKPVLAGLKDAREVVAGTTWACTTSHILGIVFRIFHRGWKL